MTIIRVVRLGLLFLSFFGYVYYLSKKIKPELCIGFVFSAIGSIMFLSGILNIMPVTALSVFLIGIYCLILSIKEKNVVKNIITPGILFFIIVSVVLLGVLKGSIFIGYDNFSHWALASKSLIENDRFANFTNPLSYYSYPLGSASFIYYFAEIYGGRSEWMQMFAQSALIAGMFTSLFAFAKNIKDNVIISVIVVFLMCSNIGFTDLLVDTLLSATAVSAISFCIYYSEDIAKKIWCLIPYIVFLISIKNSGAFFVAIVLLYVLLKIEKNKINIKNWVFVSFSPIVATYIWQQFVKMAYGHIELQHYHSMTADYYKTIFGKKTPEEINQIIGLAADRIISLHNPIIYILLFIIFIVIIGYFTKVKPDIGLVILTVSSYLIYQVGIVAMYLFSMEVSESLILASYNRYHKTIITFVAAIILICIEKINFDYLKGKNRHIKGIVSVLMIFAIYISTGTNLDYFKPQKLLPNNTRVVLNNLITEHNIEKEKKYLIISSENDGGYLWYVTDYELNSSEFEKISLKTLMDDTEGKIVSKFDYLIVVEENEEIAEYMSIIYNVDIPTAIKLN